MELTVDQALEQGVAAHKEGKLEEAERLYRAIFQSQPLHPDANHNLGVLAVSVNKADAALPLFKTALEANPKIEQFWLSYVDALIKEKQFDNAKLVIEQAKTQGVAEEKLNVLETQLTPTTQVNEPKLAVQKKRLTFSEKRKKLAEQKKQKKAKKQNLKGVSPSQAQLTSLSEHYQNGRFDDAEKLSVSITQEFPKHQFGWKVLGAVLKQTGRISESLVASQKSVQLIPQDAEAHNNLAITLQELGRLQEAEASYTQAIEVKPDFAEAHNNLGNTLKGLGRLEEAKASLRQAIALKPDYGEAHNNLGNTLKGLGRLEESEASLRQAIALKPDYAEAHYNLGNTLKELGRLDEVEASYTQAIALKPDYAEAKHMLAALSGETTATAPRDYVEGLFDNYAAKFENSLVDSLEYKIPRVIAEMIIKDSKFDLLGSIMDLGCGTGLFGMEIKQFCEHLEGIDLSEKMLDKAKGKDVYNKLIKQDIVTYLSNESLNFDYFISTDVFIYIGDLYDVFRLIKSRNKTGGKLAFSTEDYDGDGFFLEQSGRYSHSKKYIESLCKKFGYELRHFETQALRKEKNQYISGGLYLLDF
jgi:predicted TPR repeat methyltransferase